MHDWQIENEDELRDAYCDMYGITERMIDPEDWKVYLEQEYEEYLDTEEFDDTKEGCSFSEGER
jgi:hypothetical protein